LESVAHIIIRFRTAVEQKGMVYSYEFSDILSYYWKNGLIVDLFGLCPFNLIFEIIGVKNPLYIIIPLRYLRVFIIANSFSVIGNLMLINFKAASTIYISTIFCCFIFLLHITSCFWFMISNRFESDKPITWEKYNKLVDAPLVNKVVMAIYYTTKVVAGVGSGESFAATHLERIVTCVLIHIADVLFAVTFGLIAAFVSSWSTETESYLIQKNEIDDVADSLKLCDSQKNLIKEYYEYKQNPIYSIAVYQKSKELLPLALAKEVAYEMSKNLLLPFFKEIASLNFIKRLAHKVETQYFLQNDFIVNRGTISEEMFIIVDGKVTILEADKRSIYKQLEKNAYFGEIGLFYPCRRRYYAQANTHCCICIIKKQTVDALLEDFPLLKNSFKEFGERLILKANPVQDKRKGSLESRKLVPPLQLEKAKNIYESEFPIFKPPVSQRNFCITQLEKENVEHPAELIPPESKAHLSPHLESPENREIARQSFANFNDPVIKIENLDADKEEIKESPFIPKKLCFDDVLHPSSQENDELEKSPSNTVQLKIPAKHKDEPRLSQISFGKHLQLNDQTDVKMHWTLFEKPDSTPNNN